VLDGYTVTELITVRTCVLVCWRYSGYKYGMCILTVYLVCPTDLGQAQGYVLWEIKRTLLFRLAVVIAPEISRYLSSSRPVIDIWTRLTVAVPTGPH